MLFSEEVEVHYVRINYLSLRDAHLEYSDAGDRAASIHWTLI